MLSSLCKTKGTFATLQEQSQRSLIKHFSTSIARHLNASHEGILYQQTSTRVVKPATANDFFNYTAKRWLINESYERSKRFVKFNIQGLFDIAVAAVGKGATKCVRAVKLREGQCNKVFLLVMDNGIEVVAKLPNPNAGPAHYTTASEVATMDWVRSVFKIPIPAVLAWSSNTNNVVEAEYIIMEKANGVLLSDSWYQLERDSKNKIIQQIVDLQGLLYSYTSTVHGSLFYREDVPSDLCSSSSLSPGTDFGHQYTIGPLARPALWSEERNELDALKGPWRNMSTYAMDLGLNEQQWVLRNARPRMNYFRESTEAQQPAEMIELLDKYLAVVPHIAKCPQTLTHLENPSLSHPDLHLSNIFIDPATKLVTGVIDWQGAAFLPLVMQATIPRMVRHTEALELGLVMPKRPENYEELPTSARKAADVLYESALCQKYYEVLVAKKHSQFYEAIIHNVSHKAPFLEPLQYVCGCWENRETHKLRSSLLWIADNWTALGADVSSCPITFSKEEILQHDEELDNVVYIESIMEAFQSEGILPADGRVDPEDYETLQEVNRIQRERYLSLAACPEEINIMKNTWPWQDWSDGVG